MEALLHDLRLLLAQQVENLRTLEQVIRRQRACLVKRDISGIVETITEQERCLGEVQRMEADRTRLMTRISEILGLGPRGITLRKLTENLDPAVSTELRSTGETIRETLENIGRVNQDNRRLIEHSLQFVQEMMAALSGGRPVARTYGATGDLSPRPQERMLVDQTT